MSLVELLVVTIKNTSLQTLNENLHIRAKSHSFLPVSPLVTAAVSTVCKGRYAHMQHTIMFVWPLAGIN